VHAHGETPRVFPPWQWIPFGAQASQPQRVIEDISKSQLTASGLGAAYISSKRIKKTKFHWNPIVFGSSRSARSSIGLRRSQQISISGPLGLLPRSQPTCPWVSQATPNFEALLGPVRFSEMQIRRMRRKRYFKFFIGRVVLSELYKKTKSRLE